MVSREVGYKHLRGIRISILIHWHLRSIKNTNTIIGMWLDAFSKISHHNINPQVIQRPWTHMNVDICNGDFEAPKFDSVVELRELIVMQRGMMKKWQL
jgi:hypothetical protein